MEDLTQEQYGKLRQLQRLIISYQDFQQAKWIASYIVEKQLQEKISRTRGRHRYRTKLLWQALNCSMIVAYCRPFSGNDRGGESRVPDLPSRYLRLLSGDEKEIHDAAVADRNTLLAHSDSEAWNLRLAVWRGSSGRGMLVPLHSDTRAPLIHSAVESLVSICDKFMNAILDERRQLEIQLSEVLPDVDPEAIFDESLDGA